MTGRHATTTERFMQIVTTEETRDYFRRVNTNPLPEFEVNGDQWEPVHLIRYGGSFGDRNTWGL